MITSSRTITVTSDLLAHSNNIYVEITERPGANLTCEDSSTGTKKQLLVVIHGGPGLLEDERESLVPFIQPKIFNSCPNMDVILSYDQLGCGKSDKPMLSPYTSTIQYYTHELREIIRHASSWYRNKDVFLFGYSWGGQILLEFLCEKCFPVPIAGAIVSNSPVNEVSYALKKRLIHENLPADLKIYIEEEEEALISNETSEARVFLSLIGKNERDITGTMATWSILERIDVLRESLQQNGQRILFIVGEKDTLDIAEVEMVYASLNSELSLSEFLCIPDGEHSPFFEIRSEAIYFDAISAFIN